MVRITFIFLLSMLLVPRQIVAEELDYYLNLLDAHPRIQAVLEQQKSLTHQAGGAVGLPDPSVFIGVDNVPVSDPSFDQYLPSSKVVGFTQNIPNNKGRQAQKSIYLASAESSELLAEYTKSRLHSIFFTRLAELRRIKQQVGYEGEKKQVIAALQAYYEGQILAGEPLYQKTFLIEIDLSEVDRRINTLNAEMDAVEADLVQLVGELPVIDEVVFQEKKWDGEVQSLYPVSLASQNIDIEGARVNLANSEVSPDFGVSGTYKFREDGVDDSFDGDDWFSLQFRMTVPLWASKNQRPKIEAAKSRQKSAELAYRDTLRKWRMETTRLQSSKEASSLNIEVLQKKDDALKEKITAMERTYAAGQTTLEPVLQAELTRLSLLSQIAAEQQRYISFAQELNSHIIPRVTHEPN